jgi:hypothetical protein
MPVFFYFKKKKKINYRSFISFLAPLQRTTGFSRLAGLCQAYSLSLPWWLLEKETLPPAS